jgi:hypothetical protein
MLVTWTTVGGSVGACECRSMNITRAGMLGINLLPGLPVVAVDVDGRRVWPIERLHPGYPVEGGGASMRRPEEEPRTRFFCQVSPGHFVSVEALPSSGVAVYSASVVKAIDVQLSPQDAEAMAHALLRAVRRG